MSIIPFLRDSSFDPEAVAILAAAFDAAWDALQKSGSPLASDAQAMTTRERLAKRKWASKVCAIISGWWKMRSRFDRQRAGRGR